MYCVLELLNKFEEALVFWCGWVTAPLSMQYRRVLQNTTQHNTDKERVMMCCKRKQRQRGERERERDKEERERRGVSMMTRKILCFLHCNIKLNEVKKVFPIAFYLHRPNQRFHHTERVERGVLALLMRQPHIRYCAVTRLKLLDDGSILIHTIKHGC
jgi:hypothetical protein